MLSAPTSTAPAASMRRTSVASSLRRRPLAVDLRARPRRQALHVEQVLDRERRAGQRPQRLAARPRRVQRVGLRQRPLGGDVGEGAEAGIALGDPRQRGLGDLARPHLAGTHGGGDGFGGAVEPSVMA